MIMSIKGLLVAGAVSVAIAVIVYAAARERQNPAGIRLLSVQAGGGRAAGAAPFRPRPFTVLTLNIRHGATDAGGVDLPALARLIRESGADLVALQEVDQVQLRSALVDQPRWLAHELGMDYFFAPTMHRGMGRYGNVILSRFPILAARAEQLPAALEPRGAIVARVRAPGGEISVVATHLGLSATDRKAQVEALAATLSAALSAAPSGEEGPVILLGDWNAEADAPELLPVAGTYREALELAGADARATFRAGEVEPYAAIDHVFVSDGVGVLSAEVLSDRLSDHLPVVVRLLLLKKG